MPLKVDCHPHWFVADVKPNIEKSIVDALSKKGITSYFPVQKTVALSGDNKAKVITTPISPGVLYIHCTEEQRKYILHLGLHILRFVGDGHGRPKIIADSDMAEYIHQLDIRNEA